MPSFTRPATTPKTERAQSQHSCPICLLTPGEHKIDDFLKIWLCQWCKKKGQCLILIHQCASETFVKWDKRNTHLSCAPPTRAVLHPVTRTPEKQRDHLPPPPPPPVLSLEGEGRLNVAPLMRPVSPQSRHALYQDSSHHVRITVTLPPFGLKCLGHCCFSYNNDSMPPVYCRSLHTDCLGFIYLHHPVILCMKQKSLQ